MEAIEQKLDTLAEYHGQKDSIEFRKRELLDEVKVPAEIISLQDKAQKEAQKAEAFHRGLIENLRRECEAKLSEVTVPEEIRLALAAIDHERGLVMAYQRAKENEFQEAVEKRRAEINIEIQSQTANAYAALARRKNEIEFEFHGKIGAVDENIKALEAEIKAATKAEGKTVKGKYFSAIYVKGRTSWDTEGLNVYADQHPGVVKYRTVGEPSITLRRV
jgi:hypothetical protein